MYSFLNTIFEGLLRGKKWMAFGVWISQSLLHPIVCYKEIGFQQTILLCRYFCEIDLLDSVQRTLTLCSLGNTCSIVCSDNEIKCLIFFSVFLLYFFLFCDYSFPKWYRILSLYTHESHDTPASHMGSLYNEHPQIKCLSLQLLCMPQ